MLSRSKTAPFSRGSARGYDRIPSRDQRKRLFKLFQKPLVACLLFASMLLMCSPAPRILVHGHRGARAMYPENTIPAFNYAIDAGVDFLEMDVAVTKDNVLVVSHDPHMNPEICTGPHPGVAIHELTLRELREYDCGVLKNPHFPKQQPVPGTRVPTLDDVLNL